jgi:chromosome segregation ATPase
MSDIENVTQRVLRDIQRELADMRDDRTVMIAILNRLDANVTSLNTEMRALRSQIRSLPQRGPRAA